MSSKLSLFSSHHETEIKHQLELHWYGLLHVSVGRKINVPDRDLERLRSPQIVITSRLLKLLLPSSW